MQPVRGPQQLTGEGVGTPRLTLRIGLDWMKVKDWERPIVNAPPHVP